MKEWKHLTERLQQGTMVEIILQTGKEPEYYYRHFREKKIN